MRFELKIKDAPHKSFHSTEELLSFLWKEQVVFKLCGNVKPHDVPETMTYLGDVKYVGLPYKYKKSLYVMFYSEAELEALKVELKFLQEELGKIWRVPV